MSRKPRKPGSPPTKRRSLRPKMSVRNVTAQRCTVGDALDDFIGSWSAGRAKEVLDAVNDFARLDVSLWR